MQSDVCTWRLIHYTHPLLLSTFGNLWIEGKDSYGNILVFREKSLAMKPQYVAFTLCYLNGLNIACQLVSKIMTLIQDPLKYHNATTETISQQNLKHE